MNLPLIIRSQGLPVLVVGGGAVAERKVNILLEAGCAVTIIASEFTPSLNSLAAPHLKRQQRDFQSGDCRGFPLVIAATHNPRLNEQIAREAQAAGSLVNVVDSPELCTVFFPALFSRGDLEVAVSTGGKAPFLAAALRDRLGPMLVEYSAWLEIGARFREVVKREAGDESLRLALLRRFADAQPVLSLPPPDAAAGLDKWLVWLDTVVSLSESK